MTPVAPLDASGLQNWCCSALNCRSSLKQQVESLFSHCELGCEPCFNKNTGMRTLALFPCMDFLSEFILQNANMQHGLDCGCISQILSQCTPGLETACATSYSEFWGRLSCLDNLQKQHWWDMQRYLQHGNTSAAGRASHVCSAWCRALGFHPVNPFLHCLFTGLTFLSQLFWV